MKTTTLRRPATVVDHLWVLYFVVTAVSGVLALTVFRTEWLVGMSAITGHQFIDQVDVDWTKDRQGEVLEVAAGDTARVSASRDDIRLTNGRFVIVCEDYCARRRLKIERGTAIVVRGDSIAHYGAGATIPVFPMLVSMSDGRIF